MTDRHATLAEEQRAVDHAYRCYERVFAENREKFRPSDVTDSHAGTAFIPDVAPEVRLEGDLDGESLVIARVDAAEDGGTRTWYIGRRLVRDEAYEPIVINWQAPQATAWMLRRADEPGDLRLRRKLRCERARVRDYLDDIGTAPTVVPRPSTAAAPPAVPAPPGEDAPTAGTRTPADTGPAAEPDPPTSYIDRLRGFLLEDLDRARDGDMRDIIETIQREQLLLVSDARDGVLVIQGGPGTGKTAVGLHRISWLLFNRDFTTGEVLVVGPHRRFLDYVRGVLPRLGTHDVKTVELSRLWDAPRGVDPPAARLVKSDARMARVLRRAVRGLPRTHVLDQSREGGYEVVFEGVPLRVPSEDLHEFVDLEGDAPYSVRRAKFNARLLDRLTDLFAARRPRQDGGVRQRLARNPKVVGLVNMVWPNVTAETVLRGLLNDAGTLRTAAEGVLDADEQAAIARRSAARIGEEPWSAEDRVCLEELRALMSGDGGPRYRHIMVDEAQDLTPMQARALARRCPSGSMTVLGDLAQTTRDHVHRDWSVLGTALAGADGWHLAELTVGYRVPHEVMRFAEPLARAVTPGAAFPRSLRTGAPDAVAVVRAEPDRLVGEAMSRARTLLSSAADGRSVAVIVPDGLRDAVPAVDRAVVIGAADAKGLEFDHVVLVEPAAIVGEGLSGAGRLYVAATRCTRSLTVVHSAPLPRVLLPGSDAPDETRKDTEVTNESADGFEAFVAEIEAAVREERSSTVHENVRHALISELYGAGLVPTVDSPTADVICDGPCGRILYEVLGERGTTYRHMRDAVLRILEVQHAEGDRADLRVLVLPEAPAEAWAPDVLAEAFGMSVIWRDGSAWDGRDVSSALGRNDPPGGREGR
ncbi:hypothetical protein GCM10010182_53900 [Actinomadura cremea]|nr:hypothetical protein GCM10010182_53900 [Actinomadura cremea]